MLPMEIPIYGIFRLSYWICETHVPMFSNPSGAYNTLGPRSEHIHWCKTIKSFILPVCTQLMLHILYCNGMNLLIFSCLSAKAKCGPSPLIWLSLKPTKKTSFCSSWILVCQQALPSQFTSQTSACLSNRATGSTSTRTTPRKRFGVFGRADIRDRQDLCLIDAREC